jgi:hypothetical protein
VHPFHRRVNGSVAELMGVRANLSMVFQEGALFDSLSVRENVGYRLYEETDLPLPEVDARVDDVQGLKTGAAVRLNGMEVGKVTSIAFAGVQVDVARTVSKRVRHLVTSDSEPAIGSLSLLGEPIIEIRAAASDDHAGVLPARPLRGRRPVGHAERLAVAWSCSSGVGGTRTLWHSARKSLW